MTKEKCKRAAEIYKEIERLEDEIEFLSRTKPKSGFLLSSCKFYAIPYFASCVKLSLTEEDLKDFKAIKEIKLRKLKLELDQL